MIGLEESGERRFKWIVCFVILRIATNTSSFIRACVSVHRNSLDLVTGKLGESVIYDMPQVRIHRKDFAICSSCMH